MVRNRARTISMLPELVNLSNHITSASMLSVLAKALAFHYPVRQTRYQEEQERRSIVRKNKHKLHEKADSQNWPQFDRAGFLKRPWSKKSIHGKSRAETERTGYRRVGQGLIGTGTQSWEDTRKMRGDHSTSLRFRGSPGSEDRHEKKISKVVSLYRTRVLLH